MSDEMYYSLLNLDCETVEIWEWISNLIQHLSMDVITYLYLDES